MLKIQNEINHKNYKIYIHEICFKNRIFFCKVIVGYNREGDGTPLQYSCLENPMGEGAW